MEFSCSSIPGIITSKLLPVPVITVWFAFGAIMLASMNTTRATSGVVVVVVVVVAVVVVVVVLLLLLLLWCWWRWRCCC